MTTFVPTHQTLWHEHGWAENECKLHQEVLAMGPPYVAADPIRFWPRPSPRLYAAGFLLERLGKELRNPAGNISPGFRTWGLFA